MNAERLTDGELSELRAMAVEYRSVTTDRRDYLLRLLDEHAQLTRDLAAAAARESRLREERDLLRRFFNCDPTGGWKWSDAQLAAMEAVEQFDEQAATDRKEG